MTTFRSNCPLCRMLDILGDKWTLLVLRDVVAFKKRTFKEIAAMPEKIATNVLSDRLRNLTANGLLVKSKSDTSKLVNFYYPTQKAIDLYPVVMAMKDWSEKYLYAENEVPTPVMAGNLP